MQQQQALCVYALCDPRTLELRYIGKSMSGVLRPRRHTSPCELKAGTHKNNWVKQLRSIGMRPLVVILDLCQTPDELIRREIERIKQFRAEGAPLTNLTDGGEGTAGHKRSPETRMRMSIGIKRAFSIKPPPGYHPTSAQRVAVSKRQQARFQSIEHRAAHSKACGGRPIRERTTGNVYASLRDAAQQLGLDSGSISRVLSGKYVQAKGYVFEYAESAC